jgi:hypothetical protein
MQQQRRHSDHGHDRERPPMLRRTRSPIANGRHGRCPLPGTDVGGPFPLPCASGGPWCIVVGVGTGTVVTTEGTVVTTPGTVGTTTKGTVAGGEPGPPPPGTTPGPRVPVPPLPTREEPNPFPGRTTGDKPGPLVAVPAPASGTDRARFPNACRVVAGRRGTSPICTTGNDNEPINPNTTSSTYNATTTASSLPIKRTRVRRRPESSTNTGTTSVAPPGSSSAVDMPPTSSARVLRTRTDSTRTLTQRAGAAGLQQMPVWPSPSGQSQYPVVSQPCAVDTSVSTL